MNVDGQAAELETPYWRLDQEDDAPTDARHLVRRLRLACKPVVATVKEAGARPALATALLQVVSGSATAFGILATSGALEELLASGPSAERMATALPALVLVVAAYAGRGAVDAGVASAQARLVPAVRRVAEERLFDVSLRVELSTFEDPGFYDRMHRARDRGLLHLERATENLIELLGASLAVLAATAALLVLHPILVPVLALCVVPHAWAVVRSAQLEYTSMARTVTLRRRVGMIADLATKREPAPEIRACQAQPFVLDQYRYAADLLRDQEVRVGLAQARARVVGRALAGVGVGATYGALVLLLQAGSVPLAVAGTAVIAIRGATGALTRLVLAANELFEHALYIADYQAFLTDAGAHVRPSGRLTAPRKPRRISLDAVGFRYPGDGGDSPALRAVTLTIDAGETIALVGENGSGKTTLAKLIAGLYQPTEGRITWDGVDIAEFDPPTLSDRIVMVQQEPVHWPYSARDNVRIGRHNRFDPDEEALREAAARSRTDEVVDQLPHGWKTLLSKYFRNGHELSGGQWQRLAVARGLYRDAPLLIWDEPTAALDAKAEFAVYESLREMAGGRTVILITHRLASVRCADRIYLLHHGALVEQGTHEALLSAGGRYAELHDLQAQLHGAVNNAVLA